MKKHIVFLFLFGSVLAHSQESQANWKTQVTVDGVAEEWKIPLRFYSSNTGLFFSVANDSTHLFLCFQVNDEKAQMKITKAGMKIKLKAKGTLKCDASIDFPVGTKQERMPSSEVHEAEQPGIKEKRNIMRVQQVNLSAQGFLTQNGILPTRTPGGIEAAIDWDKENKMTYELAIPLKELFGAGFSLKEMTKALTIGIEINALSRPEARGAHDDQGSASDMSGAGSGGMGGGMGGNGGMGGGGMGGGGRHRNQESESGRTEEEQGIKLFDPSSFKQQFILAQKEED